MTETFRISEWEAFERQYLNNMHGWGDLSDEEKTQFRATCEHMAALAVRLKRFICRMVLEADGGVIVVDDITDGPKALPDPREVLRLTFHPDGDTIEIWTPASQRIQ